jgi:nucleotide-binding universal stress UspA family protein
MFNNILTYVDINKPYSWKNSLPKAVELAQQFNAKLHIATHIPDFGMPLVEQFFPNDFDDEKLKKQVLKTLEDFISKQVPSTIKVRAIIGKNEPHKTILKTCEKLDIDLIVISSILEKNRFHNLGTTAANITRYADCSVFVVR